MDANTITEQFTQCVDFESTHTVSLWEETIDNDCIDNGWIWHDYPIFRICLLILELFVIVFVTIWFCLVYREQNQSTHKKDCGDEIYRIFSLDELKSLNYAIDTRKCMCVCYSLRLFVLLLPICCEIVFFLLLISRKLSH